MYSSIVFIIALLLINLFDHLNAFMPCPARCVCEDERVICTNSQFNVLPIMLNPWLKELYIANNQIKKMTPLNMVYMDLEVLDLSNNQIDNLEDNIFQGLSKIKVLKLSGNKISNLTRHSLKGLDTLEHLILSNNRIREISVHAFTHLKNLKRLDLSGNQITHLDSDVFSGQTNLVDLDLSFNQLVFSNLSLEQNPIKSEYFVNLASLNLAGNQLNNLTVLNSPFMKSNEQQTNDELDQQPAYLQLKSSTVLNNINNNNNNEQQAQYTIYPKFNAMNRRPYWNRRLNNQQPVAERRTVYKKWGNLRELDLSSTQINLFEPDVLGSLTQLNVLKIRNNQLTEFTNTLFKDLVQLKSLDISNNPIEQLNANIFNSLQQLEMLNISDCANLQNINDQAFNGLTKLQRLDIVLCPKLKTVNPAMFQPLGNLKQLYLRGNSLETLDSSILNYAISLEILDVRHNQLYCDCSLKWLINVLYMYANQSTYEQPSSSYLVYPPFFEQQKQLRLELSQVNCAGPIDLKDKLIYELTNDQLHCVDLRLFIFIFTGVFVAVVIVLLIVLIAWTCVRYGKCNLFRRLLNRDTANKQTFKTNTLTSTRPSTAQRTLHKLLGTGNLYQTDKTFNIIGNKPEFTWLPNKVTTTSRFPNTTINSTTTSNYGNCNTSLIFNGNNTSTICPSMITAATTNNYFTNTTTNNGINNGNQRNNQQQESTIITNLSNGRHTMTTANTQLNHQTTTLPMIDNNYDSYLHHNYATLYETLNPPEHYASSMSTTTTLSSSIANQSQNSTNNLVVSGTNNNTVMNNNTVGNHLRNQSIRYQHPCVLQTWNPSFQNYSNDK